MSVWACTRMSLWPVGAPLSPRVVGTLQGRPAVRGAGFVTNSGLVGLWGGAALGSPGSELLLGCTRSSILLSGIFTVRPFCKPLLLIC